MTVLNSDSEPESRHSAADLSQRQGLVQQKVAALRAKVDQLRARRRDHVVAGEDVPADVTTETRSTQHELDLAQDDLDTLTSAHREAAERETFATKVTARDAAAARRDDALAESQALVEELAELMARAKQIVRAGFNLDNLAQHAGFEAHNLTAEIAEKLHGERPPNVGFSQRRPMRAAIDSNQDWFRMWSGRV